MALFINTSQRPHHWPLKELRAEFTNDKVCVKYDFIGRHITIKSIKSIKFK